MLSVTVYFYYFQKNRYMNSILQHKFINTLIVANESTVIFVGNESNALFVANESNASRMTGVRTLCDSCDNRTTLKNFSCDMS